MHHREQIIKERSSLSAIILSAGLSSRMQRFKPLLMLGGQRVVERTVRTYQDAGIEDIIVVVGHRADEVRRVLAPLPVRVVENSDYRQGMFSSVVAGVGALAADCRGFFVHPVDIPMVRPQTVARVAGAFAAGRAGVVRPVFDGRRGHPPLIDADLVPGLLKWSGNGGLRAFLDGAASEHVDVAVADAAIEWDMDTPADHDRLQAHLGHVGVPSVDECRVLMDEVAALPPAIKAHCRRVGAVARQLALAVKDAGHFLDVAQIHTAALLHDIARLEKDHATAGARLLERHGFFRIAPLVATHMTLEIGDEVTLDGAQIVYLADKLVDGDRLVGVARRFDRALEKFKADPAAMAAIGRRLAVAHRIQERVEAATGRPIEAIIDGAGAKAVTGR